jgi:hypothetical protein
LAEDEHLGGRSSSLKRNKNKVVLRTYLRVNLPFYPGLFFYTLRLIVCLKLKSSVMKQTRQPQMASALVPIPHKTTIRKNLSSASQTPRMEKEISAISKKSLLL